MRDRILSWLEANVTPPRLKHIQRVEQMCGELARHHGLDEGKARSAGLMHDLAKYFQPQRLLQMAKAEGLEIDPVFASEPHLLHADVSAIVARDEFGVEDEEILEGIRNHTLGKPNMSLLSCVVYLADTLEPGRGKSDELARLRQTCQEDIYRAVWLTSEYSLRHLLEHGRLIHPRTILTRNWAMQMANQSESAELKQLSVRIPA
ncbi:bis(5'-nucleosyl)-tetraphosphatase (symmetrical) YqeK [Phormidium sp. CCY1219]|jgi:predicted HD superfamily hydrolase involved in NAD metabolism|uniref:bis(5'-nucleosyl)-tetraphosphatase (symmetrical) YqeK n=1 Tax=Phormidium sp. CCY1219 TaxID=2886104 RepID=UPI002D1F75E8|nr:bis(5'-nucleosyl)-tetraphosphatase (symmetrical) YqeK [Phormidium sp. CCY1219]MEB3831599.1 bis(5'-nucleosyl)-tetraphosphatase (symmetrical) YqeK [Phormidium sp. CCY1219]